MSDGTMEENESMGISTTKYGVLKRTPDEIETRASGTV